MGIHLNDCIYADRYLNVYLIIFKKMLYLLINQKAQVDLGIFGGILIIFITSTRKKITGFVTLAKTRFCHFGKDHSKSKINFKRSEYFLVTIPTTKRSKIKFKVQYNICTESLLMLIIRNININGYNFSFSFCHFTRNQVTIYSFLKICFSLAEADCVIATKQLLAKNSWEALYSL